ncbi:hypothetical protein KIN20_011226 [Parelaphostrongylus tenuis]|uniref:Translation initiation factor eIF2B subunit gamma n=1 Tax=Parelaphostrongylus tenuis TaxID=148309 RepID=A0AAD5QKX4_PARTN|nr:hypothetical protein KIN20_011226 [Parelaphostrongylus tenuis]
MSELQALLLCGGSGSRMTELCNGMLKCLLPIANVPMFWYPLNTLVNTGVKDIKLFVREDGEQELSRLLSTPLFSFPSAAIEVISMPRENEEWGTADLLRHYASKITATLLCLLSDMCVNGPIPGPKVRRNKGRDFIALEKSTSRIVHMINEEDFDQPVNADAWLNKFPNVTLTAKYVDCHVYFMRHSCLATIIKERNFASLKADVIPYMLSKQCSLPCGDDKVPKCMAYLLQHGNAIVAAHVNNLGAYLEINKSVLKCLPRISSLIFTGRVFDGRLNGIHTNESLVAEDVKVGERALIKKSVIAPRCTVGEKSNIQGSVVMEGSTIGRDVKITQSIICCGAVIGDNSELVNVIVTKDQKVGANAKIHNEVVDCDDEDNAWENGL